MLSFLPLHAAGHYGLDHEHEPPPVTSRNAPDRVVSSYAVTLRSLMDSRARRISRPCRPLAVGLSTTPGLRPLPLADDEALRLVELIPGGTSLIGPRATRQQLLEKLPHHTCLHFAGHGSQDPSDLSGGALYCHDHRTHGAVTSRDIAGLRLTNAEFAHTRSRGSI